MENRHYSVNICTFEEGTIGFQKGLLVDFHIHTV